MEKFGKTALRVLGMIISILLLLLAVSGVLVTIVAILDPVGIQMSDDNNPFGTPPSRLYSFIGMMGYGCVGILSGGLFWISTKSNSK